MPSVPAAVSLAQRSSARLQTCRNVAKDRYTLYIRRKQRHEQQLWRCKFAKFETSMLLSECMSDTAVRRAFRIASSQLLTLRTS